MPHSTVSKNKPTLRSFRPSQLDSQARESLKTEIHQLITNAWGTFPLEFVDTHIFKTERIAVAYDGKRLIAFSAIGQKQLAHKRVHYVEFTVVDPERQSSKIGTKITFVALMPLFVSYFWSLVTNSFELMLITPNIRVLASLANYATYQYPNPYQADPQTAQIDPADEESWQMAQELIKKSDQPKRRLDREGLVLHGSYADMPWLIYDQDSAPWHRSERVNNFARHYLDYGDKTTDKEFVVRARFGLKSIVNYLRRTK